MTWFFPGLVLTEVVSNQRWWIGGVQPGQLFGWVNIALFALVIFLTPKLNTWTRVLVGLVFLTKIGAWLTGLSVLDAAFRISLLATSALIGCLLALERTPRVRRQASVMMILCAPLMFLQVVGAGPWTQVLTTHGYLGNGESVSKVGVPTLFVSVPDLRFQHPENIQSRPAGFLHASEFASLIIIFAFVLILTSRGRRNRAAEAAVCAAAVLSMAKIVFFTAAVAIAWIMVTGDRNSRRRAKASFVWMAVFLIAYRILFPGLFSANLGSQTFAISLLTRASDVASVLGYGALLDAQIYQNIEGGGVAFEQGVTLSGIGQLVRYLPIVLLASAIAIPTLIVALRRLTRFSVAARRMAITMVLALMLFLLAGPFLGSTVFWFCMGFGLFPVLTLTDPEYVRAKMSRASRSAPRPAARKPSYRPLAPEPNLGPGSA
jgi:hypothetical protein